METKITKHTFYPNGENGFIPDVRLVSVSGDDRDMGVHFLWAGTRQWLAMSKDNPYGDNQWLVVKTDYTPEFQEWLDEELSGYDSLETMFGTLQENTNYNILVESKFNVSWSFEHEGTGSEVLIVMKDVTAKDEYEAEEIAQGILEKSGLDIYKAELVFHESWINEIVETKVGGEENE